MMLLLNLIAVIAAEGILEATLEEATSSFNPRLSLRPKVWPCCRICLDKLVPDLDSALPFLGPADNINPVVRAKRLERSQPPMEHAPPPPSALEEAARIRGKDEGEWLNMLLSTKPPTPPQLPPLALRCCNVCEIGTFSSLLEAKEQKHKLRAEESSRNLLSTEETEGQRSTFFNLPKKLKIPKIPRPPGIHAPPVNLAPPAPPDPRIDDDVMPLPPCCPFCPLPFGDLPPRPPLSARRRLLWKARERDGGDDDDDDDDDDDNDDDDDHDGDTDDGMGAREAQALLSTRARLRSQDKRARGEARVGEEKTNKKFIFGNILSRLKKSSIPRELTPPWPTPPPPPWAQGGCCARCLGGGHARQTSNTLPDWEDYVDPGNLNAGLFNYKQQYGKVKYGKPNILGKLLG